MNSVAQGASTCLFSRMENGVSMASEYVRGSWTEVNAAPLTPSAEGPAAGCYPSLSVVRVNTRSVLCWKTYYFLLTSPQQTILPFSDLLHQLWFTHLLASFQNNANVSSAPFLSPLSFFLISPPISLILVAFYSPYCSSSGVLVGGGDKHDASYASF